MKLLVIFALLFCYNAKANPEPNPEVYGYLKNYGIPEAARRHKAEEEFSPKPQFIVGGGNASRLGLFPWQAGIVISVGSDEGVCSGSLLNNRRVLTAAHCWFDGKHQASRFTIVLGSITMFSGGVRIDTTTIRSHPSYSALLARNDIAVAYLSETVSFNAQIAPIALPASGEINENFVGVTAVASGFGRTSPLGNIGSNRFLYHVSLPVITNAECQRSFPKIYASHVCTSGVGSRGPCNGDSGGPLVVTRGNRSFLIGVMSFGAASCLAGLPAVYARVTSFMTFINQNL